MRSLVISLILLFVAVALVVANALYVCSVSEKMQEYLSLGEIGALRECFDKNYNLLSMSVPTALLEATEAGLCEVECGVKASEQKLLLLLCEIAGGEKPTAEGLL